MTGRRQGRRRLRLVQRARLRPASAGVPQPGHFPSVQPTARRCSSSSPSPDLSQRPAAPPGFWEVEEGRVRREQCWVERRPGACRRLARRPTVAGGASRRCWGSWEPMTGRDAGQGDSLLPSLFASLTEGQGRRDVSKTHFTFVSKKNHKEVLGRGRNHTGSERTLPPENGSAP